MAKADILEDKEQDLDALTLQDQKLIETYSQDSKEFKKKSGSKHNQKSIHQNVVSNHELAKTEELDTSDEEDLRNTIGNVPLKWYEDYDHIGYDLDGKKITKPTNGSDKNDQLDEFLDKMEDPNYWRTVEDQQTGQKVVLSNEDIEIIKRLTSRKYGSNQVSEFETASFFTQDEMKTPLSGRPEHKRSFVPSGWEKMQVGKYVHAIKMGWIKPRLKPPVKKDELETPEFYDLWGNENQDDKNRKHMHHLPAPKLPLPTHHESYNPPPEYLFDSEEKAKWEKQEPEDRRINFVPKKFQALRVVPAYEDFIKERFDRCLDMYLAPRQRKMRVQVDPLDLIPKLPKPKDLQPFPNVLSITYKGHKSLIKSISVHNSGQWLLSASHDKSIKCWEVSTGRCMNTWKFEEKCTHACWLPSSTMPLISVSFDNTILLINPKLGDKVLCSAADATLNEYRESLDEQLKQDSSNRDDTTTGSPCTWTFYADKKNDQFYQLGYRVKLTHQKQIKNFAWHSKGDYMASVLDVKNSNSSVIMHQMSRQKSVRPFTKMTGSVQQVAFHPFKPILFVATQRYVKVYDLAKQMLIKKLMTNVQWVSSIDVHPGGDNLIIGSYDSRLSWFDLDLSSKPYKTLKHHKKSIRNVAFHKKYPLFASASDDGTAIVSHGMVYDDLMQNALIVPLKILKGHETVKNVGVTSCTFHPNQPWLFTSGADKTIRLYTN